jgi:uncharacterized membrane protein
MPEATTMTSSTGLSSRTAAALAYSGWWVTGAILWFLERRDPFVRFHAAQAIAAFGLIALLIMLFGGLAAASLSFLPSMFTPLIAAAAMTWIGGVVLWGVMMWKMISGDEWRIPVAAELADRLL